MYRIAQNLELIRTVIFSVGGNNQHQKQQDEDRLDEEVFSHQKKLYHADKSFLAELDTVRRQLGTSPAHLLMSFKAIVAGKQSECYHFYFAVLLVNLVLKSAD